MPAQPITATVAKDASGAFGLRLVERAGGILIGAVDGPAAASGLLPGLRLVSLVAGDIEHDVTGKVTLRALMALLQRHERITLRCEPASDDDALPAALWHEDTPVVTLRPLLSAEEVAEVHRTARALAQTPHVYDPNHESVFLHADGFVWRESAELFGSVVARMREQWAAPLGVRCIEYHTYRPGGALLDPDHRDVGSVLTLSALLVDPDDLDGGEFMTWEDGSAVVHDLECGDAVIFRSERVHNVAVVLEGVRHSLVIELWDGPDNACDRHC